MDVETVSACEREWVRAAQAGDPEAFGRVFSSTSGRVYGYIRVRTATVADAEDALQDVYLKAWHGIGAYTHERPIVAWLVRIARNHLADQARAGARRAAILSVVTGLDGDEVDLVSDCAPGPQERALLRETADEALSLLRSVPLRRAAVVAMTADGWSTDEIAQEVGCSRAGVRALRFKAVEAVRVCAREEMV